MSTKKTHSVYVVVLDEDVLNEGRSVKTNPDHRAGKPCLYVGMTGRTPDERMKQHQKGYKAVRYDRRHGK
jgi:hypothetical protein